jgi:hypothetical protein
MKKIILLLSLSFFITTMYAQITFNSSDVMAIGNKVYQSRDTLPTYTNPGASGANQTWSFTGLTVHVYDSLRAVSPSSTPYAATFPTANITFIQGNDYLYLNKQSNKMEAIGAHVGMLNTSAVYQNPEQVSAFPTTYLSGFSDTSLITAQTSGAAVGITSVDSVRLKRTVYKKSFSDAWGDITTDYGTYSTLRLNDTIRTIDTVFAKIGPSWITYQATDSIKYEYTWITNNSDFGGPVVRMIFEPPFQIKSATFFSPVPCAVPLQSSSNISFSNVTHNAMTISWQNGSGDERMVIMRSGSTSLTLPQNGTVYNANSQYGDPASAIGACYVVYSGGANTVNVTGLNPSTQYHIAVIEHSCSPPLYKTNQYPMASRFTNNNVGVEEAIANYNTIKTYPNPVENELYISGIPNLSHIEVYDISGNLIAVKQMEGQNYFNTSELLKGLYILKITYPNKKMEFTKFVKM